MGEIDPRWFEREMQTMRVLYRMTRRGVPYDAPRSLQVADQIADRRAALEKTLPFNPSQAKAYYFGLKTKKLVGPGGKRVACLELEPYETTDTGQPSFTEKVRTSMARDNIPYIRTMSDIQKLDTAESMWYRPYAERTGADGRLRTYFRQTHVRSGRFSVERINLQAMPQDYRLTGFSVMEGLPTPRGIIGEAYEQYEDWDPYELDWAQAELRVAAQKAGCTKMLQMIRDGVDLHGYAASELMGVYPDDPNWFQMRQVFKRFNFSAIFGIGWVRLQYDIAKQTGVYWSDAQTQETLEGWNALYPEYEAAINKYSYLAKRYKYTTLVNGKRRWYSRDELDNTHKAFNQYVQGSLAELSKDWLIDTEKIMQESGVAAHRHPDGTEAGLHLAIHDSVLLQLPRDQSADLVRAVQDVGVKHWDRLFAGIEGRVDAARWGSK